MLTSLISEQFQEGLLDALIDSLKVLVIALVLYIIFSFIEEKIAKVFSKKNKLSPLIGSAIGLIPQCGLGVVACDMYHKHHITMGTIIALFVACSDEALPILLSSKENWKVVLPLIIFKFCLGFIIGFIVDLFNSKEHHLVDSHLDHCDHEEVVHTGCCNHPIEDCGESKIHHHLVHPLVHSLKIFLYVFVVNVIFSVLISILGEEAIVSFLQQNKYFGPLFATIIGIIPNCSSSVIITEVYLLNGISFGACLAGLIMNAGIGFAVLFKNKKETKNNFLIFLIMFISSLIVGYSTCFIIGF